MKEEKSKQFKQYLVKKINELYFDMQFMEPFSENWLKSNAEKYILMSRYYDLFPH